MKKYNINDLSNIINNNNEKVVLYGAADVGEICYYAIETKKY